MKILKFSIIIMTMLFLTCSISFAGSASGGGISNTSMTSRKPYMVINSSGNPVIVWEDQTSGSIDVFLRQRNGFNWEELDGSGTEGIDDSPEWAQFPVVATNSLGNPVVAWIQDLTTLHTHYCIYLKQWNGNSWEELGGSASGYGISNNTEEKAFEPTIAIDSSDNIVVAWKYDIGSSTYTYNPEIYVKKWNGSVWVEISSGSASGGGISNSPRDSAWPSVVFDNNDNLIIAWKEYGDYPTSIYVKCWNGNEWGELDNSATGGGISDTPGPVYYPEVVINGLGNPVVVWVDESSGNYKIYLKQWNGTFWEELNGSASGWGVCDSTEAAYNPSLTINSLGNPVVAWDEIIIDTPEIYIKQWNGISWEEMGTGSASGGGIISQNDGRHSKDPSLATDLSGNIVIAWQDVAQITHYDIYVKCWDGESWKEYYDMNSPPFAPTNLLCEGLTNPDRVDDPTPDFSWEFQDIDVDNTQSAYRIIISTYLTNLENGIGDIWDTSKSVSTISNTIYSGSSLMEDTTYYWKAKIWDNWDSSGPYSNSQSFYFLNDPDLYPNSIYDLSVTATDDCRIRLDWVNTTSQNMLRYNIYYSSETVDINYSVIMDSVAYPTETWTSPTLVDGVTYKFVVRAENDEGYEEKNTNIVSATALNEINNLPKAVIWIPQTGKKISGNRVTVMARILDEFDIPDVKEVRFQYKTVTDTVWGNIPPSQHGNTENPDNLYPYFMHWDVIGLAEREYNTRTIAYNRAGEPDPNPGFITIAVDYANPDIIENYEDGIAMRTESIDNNRDNTVRMGGEETGGGITEVIIPQGALDTAGNVSLSITDNPAAIPDIPSNRIFVGRVKDIKLGSGVNLTGIATIKIPYNDVNDDGIEDDSGVNESNLKAYTSPDANGSWEEIAEGNYTIYPSSNIIAINTSHFSLYTIMAESTGELNVITYPSPFGEGGTNFIYTLESESNVKINIYTVSGRLIRNLFDGTRTADYHDEDFWDGKDEGNSQLANGVYIYKLTATPPGGTAVTKTGKIVIMR